MFKNYKQPTILAINDMSEGVYLASGSTNDKFQCKSIYMQGVYVKGTYNPIVDGYKIGRGCEGCPANWGDKCHVEDCNYDGDFRPSWEVQGHKPDERGY